MMEQERPPAYESAVVEIFPDVPTHAIIPKSGLADGSSSSSAVESRSHPNSSSGSSPLVLVQLGRNGSQQSAASLDMPADRDESSSEFYGAPQFGVHEDTANEHSNIHSSNSHEATAEGGGGAPRAPDAQSFRDSLLQASEDVDAECLAQMTAMGFERPWAALALRRCNNNLEEAIFFCSENEELKNSLLMEEEVIRRIRNGPRDREREQQQQQEKKKSTFGSAMKNMFGIGGKKNQAAAAAASATEQTHVASQSNASVDASSFQIAEQPVEASAMNADPVPSYDDVVDHNTYSKFHNSIENSGPEAMPGISLHRSIDAEQLDVDATSSEAVPQDSSPDSVAIDSTPVAEESIDTNTNIDITSGEIVANVAVDAAVPVIDDHVRVEEPHSTVVPVATYESNAPPREEVAAPPQHEEAPITASASSVLAASITSQSTTELLGGNDAVIGSPPVSEDVDEDSPMQELNLARTQDHAALPQASIVKFSSDLEFSVTSNGVVVSDTSKTAASGGSHEAVPLVDAMLPMSISHMPRKVARAYGYDGKQFYMTVAAPLLLKDEAAIEEAMKKERREQELERRRLQNRSFFRATSDYFYGIEDVLGESRRTEKEEILRRRQLKASIVAEKLQNVADPVITGAAITLKQPRLPPNKKSPQGDRPGMIVLKLPLTIRDEKHAIKLCEVMAPPLWSGEGDSPKCVSCRVSPGVFNPVHHCRNCGYYVCEDCSDKFWPSSMLPDTFHDSEKVVRICDSCNVLMELFADALRRGDVKAAFAIYSTGNVNLRCPFMIYKSQDYPIHSAVRGGSLVLLRWLLETECCPCRDINNDPIATSKGQCLLSLAAYYGHVDIMRYLVQRQNFSLMSITDIDVLRRGLHSALGAPGPLPAIQRGKWFGKDPINPSAREAASVGPVRDPRPPPPAETNDGAGAAATSGQSNSALVPVLGGSSLLGDSSEGVALGVSTSDSSLYPAIQSSPSSNATAAATSAGSSPVAPTPSPASPTPPVIQAMPGARGHLVTGNPRYSDHVVATSQLASDVAEVISYVTHRPKVQHERKRPLRASLVRRILRILKRIENEMVTAAHHYAALHSEQHRHHHHHGHIDFSQPTEIVMRIALSFESRVDTRHHGRKALDITDPYFVPFEDSDIIPISND